MLDLVFQIPAFRIFCKTETDLRMRKRLVRAPAPSPGPPRRWRTVRWSPAHQVRPGPVKTGFKLYFLSELVFTSVV